MKAVKNVAASVRQRLLNKARSDRRPFNELLQYYAMERFLYRLSQSAHADRFILKGALLLRVWQAPTTRPTMDIDVLGKTSNEEAAIAAQIKEIMAVGVEPDGLVFDPATIRFESITELAEYDGLRVRFGGVLDSAKVTVQVDIGFGDVVYPKPEESELPTILDSPPPRLLCYSRESAIAEKFQAMVKLGSLNSRMKDFYDIWLLSRQFEFDASSLAEAVRLTFQQRGTPLPTTFEAFTTVFADDKQAQWSAFRKRLQLEHAPESFRDVLAAVESFLAPISALVLGAGPKPTRWTPPGPWT